MYNKRTYFCTSDFRQQFRVCVMRIMLCRDCCKNQTYQTSWRNTVRRYNTPNSESLKKKICKISVRLHTLWQFVNRDLRRCNNESSNAKPDTSGADKMVKNNTNENTEYTHGSQPREKSVKMSLVADRFTTADGDSMSSLAQLALLEKSHPLSPLHNSCLRNGIFRHYCGV